MQERKVRGSREGAGHGHYQLAVKAVKRRCPRGSDIDVIPGLLRNAAHHRAPIGDGEIAAADSESSTRLKCTLKVGSVGRAKGAIAR